MTYKRDVHKTNVEIKIVLTCFIKPRNIHVQILNGTLLQWNVHTFRDSLIPQNFSFKSRENINNCCS